MSERNEDEIIWQTKLNRESQSSGLSNEKRHLSEAKLAQSLSRFSASVNDEGSFKNLDLVS